MPEPRRARQTGRTDPTEVAWTLGGGWKIGRPDMALATERAKERRRRRLEQKKGSRRDR